MVYGSHVTGASLVATTSYWPSPILCTLRTRFLTHYAMCLRRIPYYLYSLNLLCHAFGLVMGYPALPSYRTISRMLSVVGAATDTQILTLTDLSYLRRGFHFMTPGALLAFPVATNGFVLVISVRTTRVYECCLPSIGRRTHKKEVRFRSEPLPMQGFQCKDYFRFFCFDGLRPGPGSVCLHPQAMHALRKPVCVGCPLHSLSSCSQTLSYRQEIWLLPG